MTEEYKGPRLFLSFDPVNTFLLDQEIIFRDLDGNVLFEANDTPSILLLAYSAMLELGAGRLPSLKLWNLTFAFVKQEISNEMDVYSGGRNVDYRPMVQPLKITSYSLGSPDIVLINSVIERRTRSGVQIKDLPLLWCFATLFLINEAIFAAFNSGGEMSSVEWALRAKAAFDNASPKMTPEQYRTQMARENRAKRRAKDPKSQAIKKIKTDWHEEYLKNPSMNLSEFARLCMTDYPVLTSEQYLTRTFRTWRKELCDSKDDLTS